MKEKKIYAYSNFLDHLKGVAEDHQCRLDPLFPDPVIRPRHEAQTGHIHVCRLYGPDYADLEKIHDLIDETQHRWASGKVKKFKDEV